MMYRRASLRKSSVVGRLPLPNCRGVVHPMSKEQILSSHGTEHDARAIFLLQTVDVVDNSTVPTI